MYHVDQHRYIGEINRLQMSKKKFKDMYAIKVKIDRLGNLTQYQFLTLVSDDQTNAFHEPASPLVPGASANEDPSQRQGSAPGTTH